MWKIFALIGSVVGLILVVGLIANWYPTDKYEEAEKRMVQRLTIAWGIFFGPFVLRAWLTAFATYQTV
jgi:hypothetical protein